MSSAPGTQHPLCSSVSQREAEPLWDQPGGEQATSHTWIPWHLSGEHERRPVPTTATLWVSQWVPSLPSWASSGTSPTSQRQGDTWGDIASPISWKGAHGLLNTPLIPALSPHPKPPPSYRSLWGGWHLLGRPQKRLLPQRAEPGPGARGL